MATTMTSIIGYVVEAELTIKSLKDERELLYSTMKNFHTRNQILREEIAFYKQVHAEEERKRTNAEFRLQLALANIEAMRRELAEQQAMRAYEYRMAQPQLPCMQMYEVNPAYGGQVLGYEMPGPNQAALPRRF